MRVLYLAPFAPDASARHAGGQFFAHYLDELRANGVEARVIAPDSPENRASATGRPRGEVTLVGVRAPRLLRWRTASRARTTLTAITPGPGARRSITRSAAFVEGVAWADVVEVAWTQFLPFVKEVRRRKSVPVVAFEHDVLTQSLQRQSRALGSTAFRLATRFASLVCAVREPRLLNKFDAVLTFSAKDAEVLRNLGVTARTQIVAPWFATPSEPAGPAEEQVVLFVGAMWRWENLDAAEHLIRRVWPLVRAQCTTARLVIAGADPPPSLLSLRSSDIEITGFLPDLDAVYRAARVFVAPLYSGAGVKFKVLQAMSHSLPVVATAVAAEGIRDLPGGDAAFAVISEDPRDLADVTRRTLTDLPWAIASGRRAHMFVGEQFDFVDSVRRVRNLYDDLTGSVIGRRS